MGFLDELNAIQPDTPASGGGFLQELNAARDQMKTMPMSDTAVSLAAGIPTVASMIADTADMLTADKIDAIGKFGQGADAVKKDILSYLSPEVTAERNAINQVVNDANTDWLDVASAVLKNPQGAASMAGESALSFYLGVRVASGLNAASKAITTLGKVLTPSRATAVGLTGTNALMNAGDTFGELEGQALADRYKGAGISGGASLLLGAGADKMLFDRLTGATPVSQSLGQAFTNFGKGVAKGGAKEFVSEAGEGGSQAVGEQVGKGEDIDWNQVKKQATLEGVLGAGQGAAMGGLSNVQMADQQEAKVEDAVAKRVNPVIDALNKLQTELQAQAQQTPVQVEEQPINSSAEAIKNPAEPIKEPTSTPVEVGAQPTNSSAEAIKEPQQIDVQPIEEQIADPDPEDVLDASSGRVDPTALQNRDRSNPDSVNQMVGIANQPDYARVGYSRDFGNGAPVVAYGAIPENQKGKRDIAIGSSGRRIPVQYAVVEADSVSTSNSAEGARNPDYGKTDRVTAIAGNGRMAGLTLAYRKGTAGNYRQALTADKTHGIDPAVIQGMRNPVLVRIMPNNHVTKDIGDESNTQTTRALSAVEQARTDSRRIDLNDLKFNADGSISNESLSRFVAAMPASERASMVDDQGRPTVQAVDRASNAIFAQAYDDDRITAMYAQATDPDAKLVINALARLAPVMAKLDGCGELDFRPALVDAVNAIVQGKKEKLTLGEIAAQQDFFTDPDVTLFIRLFALNSRSVKEAVAILSDAAEFAYAEANKEGQDMFGEVPRATRNDVIDRVQQNYETIQEHKNGKRKAEQAPDVLQDADGGVRAEEDATGRDARADQVTPDARGSESTERSETEKVKLSIAGVTGARNLDSAEDTTKRMDDLAVAEEMEEAGTDARKILVSTGWQRGADGMWRYELMDGQLTIDSFPEKGEYRLSDIFDAPELYKAYPEMKDLKVEFDFEPNSDFGGFFDEDGFRIFVNADSIGSATWDTEAQIAQNEKLLNGRVAKKNPEFAEQVKQYISKLKEQLKELQANDISTLKGTIVHEVQHAIQQKEGFAKGGSPDGFPSMSELRDDLFAVKQELRYLNDALQAQEDMDLPDTATYESGRTFADIKRKKAKAENRLTSIQEQIENYEDPWASYQKLAGETEARNADARKDWSRQKRRQTLLEKTEDVQRTEQRIKFSRNHEGSPSAEDVARTLESDKDIGDAFTQLRDNGEVEVVQSVDDLPEEIRSQIDDVKVGSYKTEAVSSGKLDTATPLPATLQARNDFSPGTRNRNVSALAGIILQKGLLFKRSDNGNIQGLYDPRTGKVYLIADALTDETAKPVFLHELGVHSAYTKNPLKLETQMKMARNMVNNGVAQGNALAIRVKQRLFDAGEIDSMSDPIPMEAAEECMAYLVEEAASADPRSAFRKWFDKLVAAIKQWLNAHGLNVNLNERDFVEIAKGNVTAMAREAGREKRLSYSKSGKAPKQSPSKQTPKASKILERDELGRFRLAPGRKLAEKVGQGLSAIDGLLSTAWKFQNAPKELRMQIREMKAKIESAGLTAKEMAEVMQSLSEAERKMISDVVEQELATGVNPPAYVMQIATQISSIMDQQADELVDLGMLSSESRDRFRGKYLPRFYMKSQDKEAQSFFARVFGAKQRLRGVAGGHMKGRGIFKEAPLDAVDQFLQLGWTVRDSKFEVVNGKVTPKQGAFASMPKGNEPVMLWRDYTKQEREQMGEIRDASYRFAVGYMETQRDLAIGRLFKAIASNPDWTSPTPRDGFEHVPVTEISETGGLLKYGALAGKYVDKVVLTHIAHIEEVQDGVKRAYRQAMAFWKEGKTAMNPVSHMNNTVGNFVSAHLAGVDMWDAKTYTKAVKSLINADALYKEARETGLFTGSFSQEEFVETMPENLRHLFKSEEGKFKKFGDMFMNVLTWGLRKKMRNAYEMEDALFKMAIYTKCREAGMEPAESVDYAHRYIFVYDVLPEGARKIRDSVLPFFGWTYQAVPMIARSAVSYPWRFFAPAAILFAINTAYYMSAVGDDDDDWIERFKKARELEKAERGLLPDYMKGYTIFMTPKFLRLGVDESTGLPKFLNMSSMVPGGTFLDFENQMGGIPWPEVIVPSHPVINAYATFFANKDAFSGFDVTKKTDTPAEKVQTFADRAWKLISPSIAVGNYHWNRMMDGVAAETGMTMPFNRTGINRYGEATTLGTAVQNLAGFKVRTVDFDNELDRKLRGYAYEARQIKSEMRSAGRLAQKGALPKDAATEKIEVGKEKIGKIKEKIDESRRSHADIQRLTK